MDYEYDVARANTASALPAYLDLWLSDIGGQVADDDLAALVASWGSAWDDEGLATVGGSGGGGHGVASLGAESGGLGAT